MKKLIARIRHWFNHDWEFVGGHWVIPNEYATTKRYCHFCKLYQEVGQDHVNRMRWLDKEEKNYTLLAPEQKRLEENIEIRSWRK